MLGHVHVHRAHEPRSKEMLIHRAVDPAFDSTSASPVGIVHDHIFAVQLDGLRSKRDLKVEVTIARNAPGLSNCTQSRLLRFEYRSGDSIICKQSGKDGRNLTHVRHVLIRVASMSGKYIP